MTIFFVLSLQYHNCSVCEKEVISYEELMSLTPWSAFGIRLSINLKYICAYSVQSCLQMVEEHIFIFEAHGGIGHIAFPPGITTLEQITDPYNLCIIFYALSYPSQFIKSGLINFQTQENLPVFFFSKTSTLTTTILRPTLEFRNIVHF